MSDSTEITWKDGMAFDAKLEGATFGLDADAQFGGRGYGPKPKGLVLTALAGCTGMDVVSILRKMRMPFDSFGVKVDAELTDDHPKVYRHIHVVYTFTGSELDPAKIERAVKLSQEQYCGVIAMLAKTARVTYAIEQNPSK